MHQRFSHYILPIIVLMVSSQGYSKSYQVKEPFRLDGLLEVTIQKLSDKGKSFDLRMDVTNLMDRSIVTNFRDINCSRGGVKGEVRFAKFGIGERALDIGRGQTKNVRYICRIKEAVKPDSDILISFGPIFDNPSGDGAAGGKELAKSFDIKIQATP